MFLINASLKKNLKGEVKMKKFVSIILAVLLMSILFAGCSKTDNPSADNVVNPDLNHDDIQADDAYDTPENNNDEATKKPAVNSGSRTGFASSTTEFLDKIGELVDLSLYEIDQDEGYVELELKEEYQKSFNFNYKINIGSNSIILPVTYTDMKNSAFLTDVSDDKKISNEFEFGVTYEDADGKEFTLNTTNTDALMNDEEVECNITDCTFYGFNVYVYEEDADGNIEKDTETADFNIYGINNDSTVEDVIRAMNNPTYISFDADYNTIEIEYSEKIGNGSSAADYSRLSVDFYAAQNYMENINYKYAPAAVR